MRGEENLSIKIFLYFITYFLDSVQKMKHQILKNDKDEEYTNKMTSGATDKFLKIKTVTILLISHFLFK